MGMNGSTLISCLAAIRSFFKAQHGHTYLYEPLIQVLENVKSLTEGPARMIMHDKRFVVRLYVLAVIVTWVMMKCGE